MALDTKQIADLNALNKRISEGYKPTDTDTANLAYATKQGYTYNPLPTGATKISDPNYLKGLNESQIYRSGQDIYKLPEVPTTLTTGQITNPSQTITPVNPDQSQVDSLVSATQPTQAGLETFISEVLKPSPSEAKISPITSKINDLTGQIANKPTDYQAELDKYGFKTNVQSLQNLNTQLASAKAEYDKLAEQNANRPISSRIIGGTADRLQRSAAINLGSLSSIAQALQGNVNLAMDIANKTIDIKYEPIQTEIDNQKFQLNQVYDQLDREDKRKADALNIVLDERQRNVDEQKQTEQDINSIMLSAAQNGADSATLQNILRSKTLGEAIINSGQYIKTATSTTWDTFTDSSGNIKLINRSTGEVKNISQATTNLGTQIGEIFGLPSYDTSTANPGMNRSDRNNNPGNIKVSDYTKNFAGVIGVESNPAQDGGNFLIFDSPESGINAIGRLLLEGKSYQGVNAETAIKRYNGNGAYGAKDVGLDHNRDFQSQISDPAKLQEVATLIAQAEGFTGGVQPSNTAQDYAKLIQEGKMKIENVPAKERDAVVAALATMPSEQDTELDLIAKEKAQIASTLKSHNGLSNAVGTIKLGRFAPFQWGQKADFIASVEQLVSDLSLESLIDAKSRGATFGALSDSEMRILASAATKIGTWRQRDKDGNVTGYKASESAFRNELDNISKIFLRAVKGTTLNQSTNTTQTSTPIMTGKTPGGMGYQVIE